MNVRIVKAILAACTILVLTATLLEMSAMAQFAPNFPTWCNQNGIYYHANLATDTSNCGGCGLICPGGTPCKAGKCVDCVSELAKRKLIRVNQNPNDTKAFHTIQEAVNAANPCDTIVVAAGTYQEKVRIDKALSIKGAGDRLTAVDGNQAGLVFEIGSANPGVKVTLSDLKVQNGLTVGNGGGILNSGTLMVSRCNITGNTAREGAGIYNAVQGISLLTVSNSTISGNTATDCGGGIFNWGDVTISGSSSKITGNIASNAGGGIYSWGNMTLSGSTVSGNIAKNNSGGGIFNYGSLAVTSRSIVSGNRAASNGGGILNTRQGNSSGTLRMNDSSLVGNAASGTASSGGAIYNEATATIDGCTIGTQYIIPRLGNTAAYGGGISNFGSKAMLTVTNSNIAWNRAKVRGGGIYNEAGKLTCDPKQVHNNSPDNIYPS